MQQQRSIIGTWLITFLTFLAPVAAIAEEQKGLSAKLIATTKNIVPGKPLQLGLHIKHDKGFHTYWKNPGMVGLATDLKWKLPEGFTASKISWPYPERTHMAEYPCHGYERDVTLLFTIFPSKEITQKELTLTAAAQWMCCSNECYPGFQDLSITLPVSSAPIPDEQNTALIENAKKEIPPFTKHWQIELISKADASPIKLRLKANSKTGPTYLYSKDGQISSDQKQVFTQESQGVWLLTIARSEYSPEEKKALPLVLQAGDRYHSITPRYAD